MGFFFYLSIPVLDPVPRGVPSKKKNFFWFLVRFSQRPDEAPILFSHLQIPVPIKWDLFFLQNPLWKYFFFSFYFHDIFHRHCTHIWKSYFSINIMSILSRVWMPWFKYLLHNKPGLCHTGQSRSSLALPPANDKNELWGQIIVKWGYLC